jgi:hypothetical protein
LAATIAARWINPRTAIGGIKSDEATYISMALSVAKDGDLQFEKADLDRFQAIYPSGPSGIFLKSEYALHPSIGGGWPFVHLNRTAVPTTERLGYGKSFAYAVAAAPFVVIGGVGGLVVFNVVLLGLSLVCAVRFAQAQTGRLTGAVFGSVFFLASVVPVYVFWLMPEVFNLTLVVTAYFLWLYKEVAPADAWPGWRGRWTDLAAAALIGIATFSKINHVVFIGPIVAWAVWKLDWRRAVLVGAIGAAVGGGLFAVNLGVSGVANYQGALASDAQGRKTFYDRYPFDATGMTYAAGAGAKVTNDLGSADATTRDILVRLLPNNLWYFLVGRDAGLLPFYCPGLVIFCLWLVRVTRATLWQMGCAAAFLASMAAFLVAAPDSWNGDGGPVGNRYILSTYPMLLFLIPRGLSLAAPILSAVIGWAFTAPMLWAPLKASREPWTTVEREPFPLLPVELTMPTSLPAELHGKPGERARVFVTHDPDILFTYMDENAYGLECDGPCGDAVMPDRQWIAGDATADIMIRTELKPLTRLTLEIGAKFVPNDVKVTLLGVTKRAHLEPGEKTTMVFTPKPGVWTAFSWNVILRITTSNGFVPATFEPQGPTPDTRNLGVMVRYSFEIGNRPIPLRPAQRK